MFVGNAFGKLAGSTQVDELGTIETPIVLTNTLSVGTAIEAVVAYTLAQAGNGDVQIGERARGRDQRRRAERHPRPARDARTRAGGDRRRVGRPGGRGQRRGGHRHACASAGRAGIGTASRVLPPRYGGYTLGVLVQTNFGGVLTIGGRAGGQGTRAVLVRAARRTSPAEDSPDGSCMIVVATDAPVDARDLRRIAARAVFGLARTGSSYSNGSGDFAIAFSTSPEVRTRFGETAPRRGRILPPDGVSPLFQAALEATEEAVYNSLFRATTVTSRGRTAEAIPIDKVQAILKKYGR